MSNARFQSILADLDIPDDLRNGLATIAAENNLDPHALIESYRAFYRLGFCDGAVFAAGDVAAITSALLTRGGRA